MSGANELIRLDSAQAASCVPELADLLIDCVHGGASASFMAPLSSEKAQAFWRGVAEGVARGERVLLLARDDAGRISGSVQLLLNLPENQPHRADVAKLLVRGSSRRQGIAQRLMHALDREARAARRSLVLLDSVTGGAAERLYQREGW